MKRIVLALLAVIGLSVSILQVSDVMAAPVDVFKSCQNVTSEICDGRASQKLFGAGSVWNRILNVLIFLVGAVATIMIVVGGLRYTLSGGDSNAVNGAKNTILYAVVGMIVAVMSYAIVNFVMTRI